MYTAKVKFDNVVDAQKFVGICNDMNFKVELLSGAYVINAKSIMGIFSLDFSQPVELRDRKSTRLNSSHTRPSRMPSSA